MIGPPRSSTLFPTPPLFFFYAVDVTAAPATRTEQVYEVLRSELLNGVLYPSQKLKMVELTERFGVSQSVVREALTRLTEQDRKSTRLNSSHANISYAVFCLK